MLAVCNSRLRVASFSNPLDHRRMGHKTDLAHTRAVRRARLNELLKTVPAAELERLTGLDAAYIYQMAKGEGRNKRGISDATAEKIERAMKMAPGSLSKTTSEVAEEAAPYGYSPNREMLRDAFVIVERALAQPGVRCDAEGRAKLTLEIYEILQQGQSAQVAERILAGMLRALTDHDKVGTR